ncbi:transposase [Bifidobacterium breve]|nr:transposase [Bifidobacterium breve]
MESAAAWLASCFPIAVFLCLATENRTQDTGHAPIPSPNQSSQNLGRYPTEVHVVSDGESTVVEIHLSPGNEHDAAHGRRSMAALGASVGAHLLMGRAYEGDSTRLPAESFGLAPVVSPKRNRTAPWDYDREAHKGRNMVERVFNRMKHHRKAATRYDRLDATFLANLQLILIAVYLKNTAKNPT